MAWAEVAQAVTTGRVGPAAPKRMEIMPAAMLEIIMGMMKGEIFLGPC